MLSVFVLAMLGVVTHPFFEIYDILVFIFEPLVELISSIG